MRILLPKMLLEPLWRLRLRWISHLQHRGLVESFNVMLMRQLRQLEVRHVLDVGANRGQYALLLRRLGYEGFIYSFEPIQSNVALLRLLSARDPRWLIQPYALGSREGEETINVMSGDDFSSILRPTELCQQLFRQSVARTEKIQVKRLDSILESLAPEVEWRHLHLKSDTQGFDMHVVDGAGRCIKDIRSLQIELSVIGIYEDQPDYLQTISVLEKKGFRPTCLFPISRAQDSIRIVEFDALLVRP